MRLYGVEMARRLAAAAMALGMLLSGGCVIAPRAAKAERDAMQNAGDAYAQLREERWKARAAAPLPAQPTWRDVLERALWANGGLEAAYFEWAAAVEVIPQAGSYPNTNLSFSASYMFSSEKMKAWDRTTLGVQPDAMANLALPNKVYQNALVATDAARAAGKRFAAAKFDLQQRVLTAWMDYALSAERLRLEKQNLELLKMARDTAEAQVRAGASQGDLLKAQMALATSEDRVRRLETALEVERAGLNALMGRSPMAALVPPEKLPPARGVGVSDSQVLLCAAEENPELAALALEVKGRADALELAKLEYLPDINPMAALTGDVSQMLGVMVSIPQVRLPALRGAVAEARARWRGAIALADQAASDKAASAVVALVKMRDAERVAEWFEDQINPIAERIVANARLAYANGTGSFAEMIDASRELLEVQGTIAEARMEREKSLAELEALLATDIETLQQTQSTSQPMRHALGVGSSTFTKAEVSP